MDKMTMEDIGYFLYMQQMEQRQQPEQDPQTQTEASKEDD